MRKILILILALSVMQLYPVLTSGLAETEALISSATQEAIPVPIVCAPGIEDVINQANIVAP